MAHDDFPQPETIKTFLPDPGLEFEVPETEEYFRLITKNEEDSPYFYELPTLEEVKKREDQFALKIVYGAAIMASRRPDSIVTMLFDIDQTIRESVGLVRPGLAYALNILHGMLGDRIEAGVLSNLPQAGIDQNLPTLFEGVLIRVNPRFAISSHARESEDPRMRKQLKDNDFSTVEAIVDPNIIQATRQGKLKDLWFDSKLIIQQEQSFRYPDRSFVYVDDRVHAGVISNRHPRVMGLWVAEEAQNDWLPRGLLLDVLARQQ